MRSFRQNKEQIKQRAHEASDQLREKKDQLKDQLKDSAQTGVLEVKASLHRRPLEGGGDWDYKNPGEPWNRHEKVARWSRGYLTLANVVSVGGAGLTAYGLYKASQHEYKAATLFMGTGRLLDLADGKIAQKTGTCSDKGAAIDAGLDKLLAVAALTVYKHEDKMSTPEVIGHGAVQAAIFRESVLIKNHGGEPNPSEDGKMGSAAMWLRMGGIVLSEALESAGKNRAASAIEFGSEVLSVYAISRNVDALNEYRNERFEAFEQQQLAA